MHWTNLVLIPIVRNPKRSNTQELEEHKGGNAKTSTQANDARTSGARTPFFPIAFDVNRGVQFVL
jgi:hypothetical protein